MGTNLVAINGANGAISDLGKIGLGVFGGYILIQLILLIISLVPIGFAIKTIIDLYEEE